MSLGVIQVLHIAVVGGGVRFTQKKHYEGVQFIVISVTRGWVGVKTSRRKALRINVNGPFVIQYS